MIRVYRKGSWPKKKKIYYPGTFPNMKAAKNFVRARKYEEGITIEVTDRIEK